MEKKLILPCDVSKVSDGHHTFEELYSHRYSLFLCLMNSHKSLSWYSELHNDGTMFDGQFIAGMDLPTGRVTYHLPVKFLANMVGIKKLDRAPEWDGHTSDDVYISLVTFCTQLQANV